MGRNHSVLGRIKLEIRRLFVFVIRESIREAVFMVVKMCFRTGKRKDGITGKSALNDQHLSASAPLQEIHFLLI
jgi:hypothetical protein